MAAPIHGDEIGPVDVAVIALEGPGFTGDVAPAIADLQASGTVNVIDLAFVRREADGSATIVELGDPAVDRSFEKVADSRFDLLSDADLTDLAASLEPSSAAVVVVWENRWATRFASAVEQSRGRVAMIERVPRENVARALTALEQAGAAAEP
ncbi:MAG TPA: DUF6325 family protein [Streptosporangiaceae bacterium]|nr:DUF6325 family protein [Streptosporangiaceae bacterium]